MKNYSKVVFLIIFLGLRSYAQKPENFLGTWEGQFKAFNGKDTITASGIMELSSVSNKYIMGRLKYTNVSDNVSQNIKGIYVYLDGYDQFTYSMMTHLKNSTKTSKGVMTYKFSTDKLGQKHLYGNFKANKSEDDSNEITSSLQIKGKDDLLKFPTYNLATSSGNSSGISPSSSSAGNIIHLVPNPIPLNADKLYFFNEGYAVIQKGQSFAMIDRTGKLVIPYNKYNFQYNKSYPTDFPDAEYISGVPFDSYGYYNGLCRVQDLATKKWGMIDSHLQLVIPCIYEHVEHPDKDGFVWVGKKGPVYGEEQYILNRQGKVIMNIQERNKVFAISNIRTLSNYYNPNNLVCAQKVIKTSTGDVIKGGYISTQGNIKIPFQFDLITPFHDGLAAVAKKDDFGIVKWGFINTQGELVIPHMYTNKPGDFYNGRALVEPVNKDEYNYGYIDKKGNLIIKLKIQESCRFYQTGIRLYHSGGTRPIATFREGHSIWGISCDGNNFKNTEGTVLMDTMGHYDRYIDLLAKSSWPTSNFTTLSEFVNNEILVASRSGVERNEITAIANVKGEIIIRTPLEGATSGAIYTLFDPISNLTMANIDTDGKVIVGYVNRRGEMIMVKSEPGKW